MIEFARRLNPRFAMWCNDKIVELMKNGSASIGRPDSMSKAEALLHAVTMIVEQEKRLKQIEVQAAKTEARMDLLEAKQTTSPDGFFTIAGYASLKGIKVNTIQAAKRCRENGISITETSDPRFGKVKLYPEDILKDVFEE